ncbi:NACHT, LRR and PYD domains-containing protein 3 isoform X2 [Denticeps clupeoides]|uniref:NACHT, LRR and PYD domains-containing protein 3 isoform X2 n=1 Tax=Denticeps clupeoides TaxID=299321 RepID=UPI0010A3793B|nr:NACHT, LRR and PYD domains-containing protein 3-like isoform X2 [Denticeps clupeoides]
MAESPVASYVSDDGSQMNGNNSGAERPPSSYGSMRSDDYNDHENNVATGVVTVDQPVSYTRVYVQRSSSPETILTEQTSGQQSSIQNHGVFIRSDKTLVASRKEVPQETLREGEEYMELDDELRVHVVERPVETEEEHSPAGDLELLSGSKHPELCLGYIFRDVLSKMDPTELLWFKRELTVRREQDFKKEDLQDSDVLDVVDRLLERCELGKAVQVSCRIMFLIDRRDLCKELEKKCMRVLIQYEVKEYVKRRFEIVFEGVPRPGRQTAINNIYVEQDLLKGGTYGVNTEHEIRQVTQPNSSTTRGSIRLSDLFKPHLPDGPSIRNVLITGIPLAGLSLCARKVVVDWANETAFQEFQLVFLLPCEELHLTREENISFSDFMSVFCSGTKDIDKLISQPDCRCLFILDALELARPNFDFTNNQVVTDVTDLAPTDALLTSLILGHLLPGAKVLMTSHYGAASLIPDHLVHRHLESQGFTDEQKDEFFTKRFSVPELGMQVLAHVKSSRTLYIMSHLPLFAWMVACIFERGLQHRPGFAERPPHESVVYVQFVIVQVNRWMERYRLVNRDSIRWTDTDKDMLMKLGKMALSLLEARRVIFHKEDLDEYELNMKEVTEQLGLVAEVPNMGFLVKSKAVRQESKESQAFAFLHLTVQEFLAAFYVYLSFRVDGKTIFEQPFKKRVIAKFSKDSFLALYRPAVDRALASPDGHLDMFLRFMFGMVMDSTEDHLRGFFLSHYMNPPRGMDEVVSYVRKRIAENALPDRCCNLQRCLDEMTELP